jgi:hypothetical protein
MTGVFCHAKVLLFYRRSTNMESQNGEGCQVLNTYRQCHLELSERVHCLLQLCGPVLASAQKQFERCTTAIDFSEGFMES